MTSDCQFYPIIVQEETKPVSQTTPEDLQMPMLKPKTQTQPESVFGNTQKSTKRDSDTAAFLDKIVNGKTNTNDTHVQPCSESCMVGESGANWDENHISGASSYHIFCRSWCFKFKSNSICCSTALICPVHTAYWDKGPGKFKTTC